MSRKYVRAWYTVTSLEKFFSGIVTNKIVTTPIMIATNKTRFAPATPVPQRLKSKAHGPVSAVTKNLHYFISQMATAFQKTYTAKEQELLENYIFHKFCFYFEGKKPDELMGTQILEHFSKKFNFRHKKKQKD